MCGVRRTYVQIVYRQPEGQGLSASEEEELCFALVQIINIKQWNLSTAETDLNKPLKAQTIQALGPTPAGTFTVLEAHRLWSGLVTPVLYKSEA